ncbi:MAG: SDR family oxidoreductase [Crocinitomicaceae bacterium]|nr:SDR family oxidoreductase [Crocinitomicaceae bacterium]
MDSAQQIKVILITGASGGLGKYLTQYFLEIGYYVVAQHHQNNIDLSTHERLMICKADLTRERDIQQLFENVEEKWGNVDILINNAGVSNSNVLWKTTTEDWQNSLDVNLTAPFLMSRYAVQKMRAKGWGRIIHISSVVAQQGVLGTAAYAASKAGLFGLTKNMGVELAPFGITVNCIALGYFNQGMIKDVPAELQKEIISKIPLKKLGEPESICKLIGFLILDSGDYMTGQIINLNGGLV